MKHAAIYLRISREDIDREEDKNSESIENQRMILYSYAKRYHILIIREYVDENYSGLTDDRPGFRQMMEDARKREFEIVLAKNQARFSRNIQHIERYLHKEFQQYGIRFIGVSDGTDTADKSNKKTRQIYGLVNEWYSEDLSESVRAVLYKKVQNGQFIGSFAPYGYQKCEWDSHRLCIKQDEARIVQMIFQEYLSGVSMRGICRILERKNILTPRGKSRWNPVTIKRILTNEVYLGHLQQRKSANRSYKNQERIYFEKKDWVVHFNMHQPIISAEVFGEVQKRIDGLL